MTLHEIIDADGPTAVGRALGVDHSFVSRWRRGKKRLAPETWLRVAEVYGERVDIEASQFVERHACPRIYKRAGS